MADFNLPTVSDSYTNIIAYLKNRDLDVAMMLRSDIVTVTNPQTNMIRWNNANKYWEHYNGGSWVALISQYAIDVTSLGGSAAALYALLASPTFTGTPAAPTAAPGTNTTQIATTAFVAALGALKANIASPVFTGDAQAVTPSTGDNDTSIATTAFVKAQLYATLASPTFTGTVTISEALSLSGDISPAQITSNQNNYAPTGFATCSVLRVNSDVSGRAITGLAGGSDGRVVTFLNIGSFGINFTNNSGSSSAANRFQTGSNITVPSGSALTLFYDSTSSLWRLVSGPAAAPTAYTLTDGATINWDVSLGSVATVTLGGNRTIAAPTNLAVGTYILTVIQDTSAPRTLTWNSVFRWDAGVEPALSTTNNAIDLLSFHCDGTNLHGGIFVRGSAI